MSKISISSANSIKDSEATAFLHKTLGCALSSASKMLSMGEKGFFYTCELFLNDHIKKDKEIRNIIKFFSQKNIPLMIVEIGDDDDWADIDIENLDEMRISEKELLNMLDSSKGDFS